MSSEAKKSEIRPGHWIAVGVHGLGVIMDVTTGEDPPRARVAYLQHRRKAIAEWFVWREGKWEFEDPGPCGSYVNHMEPKLRRGPWPHETVHW